MVAVPHNSDKIQSVQKKSNQNKKTYLFLKTCGIGDFLRADAGIQKSISSTFTWMRQVLMNWSLSLMEILQL